MSEEEPGRGAQPPELSYPCHLVVKAIGADEDDFAERVVVAVRSEVPDLGEGAVTTSPSRNGRFLAVRVAIEARSESHLEAVYIALRAVEGVAYVL